MNANIKSDFWTDEKIENLAPEQKFAIVWLITNPNRDLCGFTHTTPRRFTFETGLQMEDLQRACDALPRGFQALPGNVFFVSKFLRHQFGNGETLNPKNKVIVGAVHIAEKLPEGLRRAFFEAYPELLQNHENTPHPEEGLQSPSEGMPRGKSNSKSKSDDIALEEGSGETPRPPHDPVSIVGLYPRRQGVQEAITIVARDIANGVDPQTIIDGTRAIAAVISQMPSGHLNAYVAGAARFFRDKLWGDQPETWLRNAGPGSNGGKPSPLSLGGRTGTTIRIGNP